MPDPAASTPEVLSAGRRARTLWVVLGMALGAGLGAWVDHQPARWVAGALTVLALGSTAWWLIDGQRVRRLLDWASGSLEGPAPEVGGPLGELAQRLEKALRERERRATTEAERLTQFLQAIEASPNGVLLLDENDTVQWLNGAAALHFGLDRERDLLQRVTNLVRAPAFVAHLQAGPSPLEVVFPSPRGDAMLSVLLRPYGRSMRLMLSQDITERERNDTMRRDLVANVSHEIRSPLTVLVGFIETLADLPLSPAERERVLHLMRQQSDRMQALVTDLLALAQIEGAPRPPADRWVDAAALMHQLHSDALQADQGRHEMHFTAPGPDLARLAGVQTELHSAFWNLLSNALRYTPAGGSITATLRRRADGTAEFGVADNGPGIEREHIPRLTERFYRVDASRSRATGGTGLGLAIVKHVVQRHGGELLITSEPGKGSQFRIVLPAQRVQAAQAQEYTQAA